jgi:hypothetical protein
MSLVQECAEVEASIERARSLFSTEPEPATAATDGAGAIRGAAQSNGAAGQLTGDLSGALIAQHTTFVEHSTGTLGAAARSDATLNAHVTTAAVITQTGAARLAAIAAETQATSRGAATVSTPAGERAVLAAPCALRPRGHPRSSTQPNSRPPN